MEVAKLPIKFNVRTSADPEDAGCYLSIGQDEHLQDCKFNVSAKSFFVIHGWTVRKVQFHIALGCFWAAQQTLVYYFTRFYQIWSSYL